MHTSKEGLIGEVKAEGSFACGDHEIEFRILRQGSWAKNKIPRLDCRRAEWPIQKSA